MEIAVAILGMLALVVRIVRDLFGAIKDAPDDLKRRLSSRGKRDSEKE